MSITDSQLELDIKKAKKLIEAPLVLEIYGKHSSIYPHTTENLRDSFSSINFSNKRVLSIGSSGDHALNAFLYGAKSVDCFDINALTKYYIELKLAAAQSLNFREFVRFFSLESITDYERALDYNVFLKICNGCILSKEAQHFWDSLYSSYSGCEIKDSLLFKNYDARRFICRINQNNPYLQKNNYQLLKDRLEGKKIKFIRSTLHGLPENIRGNQYDVMLFSNVTTVKNNTNQLLHFNRFMLKHLSNNIAAGGEVSLAYLYFYLNPNIIDPIFYKDNYKILEFQAAQNGIDEKDSAIIYTKK